MFKRTKIASIVILLLLLVTNCTSRSGSSVPITIAVVENDPANTVNPVPQSAFSALLLAASQLREENGTNIKVVPYADHGDPDEARQVAEEIVNSDAVAVIGHSSIEASQAAGEVYDRAGLPFINYIPVSEYMTDDHPYMFNLSYTAESEAAYIANYVRNIMGEETATIIASQDEYGQTLAKKFKNTFTGLGGKVTIEEEVGSNPSNQTLEEIVSTIISADPETNDPGTIFLATDDVIAAQLVELMKRKGLSHPITGASNLGTDAFRGEIEDQQEEAAFSGYFTDDILTTQGIIFDSTDRYANQFKNDYETIYDEEPGDVAVNAYDAALVLASVFQAAGVTQEGDSADARRRIYNALLTMDDLETSVQGVASPIYFEPSRNVNRAPRFGVYQNGRIISDVVQFQPILNPDSIKDLRDQLEKGRIMTVDGDYVHKANVVYTGIDLLGIDEIDIKNSTYLLNLYLWFRYRPDEQDPQFTPDEFEFANAVGDVEQLLVRDEKLSDGSYLKTYRVSGLFKDQFQFGEYPFDHQNLTLEFRNKGADTTYIQYVVDQIGMRYENDDTLLENFRANGAFDSIFGWKEKSASVTQNILPTYSTLGSPQNFGQKSATNYSLIKLVVDLQRDSLQFILKSLLPLLLTLALAYITLFLPLGHSERLAVGSTALLTTAFFHLSLAGSLPEIGYTVAMEYLFFASYAMSALIVLFETLSIRYDKLAEETKDESQKDAYRKRREKLNLIERIVYPLILVGVLFAGYMVYDGKIHLGQQEEQTRILISLALTGSVQPRDGNAPNETSTQGEDKVVLRINTWRPEDDEQLQTLFDKFHAYAEETLQKDIVVVHEPIVSVNYDSILNSQLENERGPDLFYVKPFSVNGSIAKFLEPLNDELPIDENYDATKTTPWTGRNGNYYALPYVGVIQGVYYNKDLFEKYGISEPQTWNDFMKAVETIKEQDPEIIPIANGLNATEDSEMFMSIAANFLEGPAGRARLMRTDGTALCYNSPRVTNIFKAVDALTPYLPENAGTTGSQTSKELFFDQKAAMLFGGSWDLQRVADNADFEWDVFASPAQAGKQTYVIFQPDIGIGLNKDSENKEAAREFLKWLTTKDALELTSSLLPGFYPLNINKPSTASDSNDQKFWDLAQQYPSDIRWMFTEISDEYPRADAIIRQSLYQMISSGLTPEQAAQNLQNGLGQWYEPAQSCKR